MDVGVMAGRRTGEAMRRWRLTRREFVAGPVGRIECAVDEPDSAPRGVALIAHPHPLYGGSLYDDRVGRARLAQAFGRLIRSKDDRGHFVVLSPAFPSRLLSAFPKGTPVIRCTLDEALQRLGASVCEATPTAGAEQEGLP